VAGGFQFGLGNGGNVAIAYDNFSAYETDATNAQCGGEEICDRQLCDGWTWMSAESGEIAGYFAGDLVWNLLE